MDEHEKLFPSLTTPEREKKPHIIVVNRSYGSTKIFYRIINAETEKELHLEYKEMEIDVFVKTFSFKNVKAVILNNCDYGREYSNVDEDVKMREKVSALLQSMKVPYMFTGSNTFSVMPALMCANIVPKIDERLLVINILVNEFMVVELLRKNNGYEVMERRDIKCDDGDRNFEKLRSDILGQNNPTKFIVTSIIPPYMNLNMIDKLKNQILKNQTLIFCTDDHLLSEKAMENLAKASCAIARNMYDPSYTTYHILPSCQAYYCISQKRNFNDSRDIITVTNEYNVLPQTIRCTVDRSDEPFHIFCYDKKMECLKHVKTVKFDPYENALYDRMELYFHVDANDIPFLYHYSLTEGEAMRLTSEMPVIGFFRNLSYIRIKNENVKNYCEQYEFLERWSDKFGKPTFLSFEEEKPKLISQIDDSCNMKSIIKLQDIIKVMSMPSEKIVIHPTWNFEITSNSENPVLIGFENFNREFTAASPAFLFAIIIKNLLKIIRQSTKVKQEQIGLYLIDKWKDGDFDKDEKERIENGFEEACKLLKVEYFSAEEVSRTLPMSPVSID